jgi:hypothetical protein
MDIINISLKQLKSVNTLYGAAFSRYFYLQKPEGIKIMT